MQSKSLSICYRDLENEHKCNGSTEVTTRLVERTRNGTGDKDVEIKQRWRPGLLSEDDTITKSSMDGISYLNICNTYIQCMVNGGNTCNKGNWTEANGGIR